MQIIRKLPGHPAVYGMVEETFEAIREEVGGYALPVTLVDGLVMFYNEDAHILGMEENFPIQTYGMFHGPVVFVRQGKDYCTSVSEEDMRALCDFIGFGEMGFPLE